MTVEEEKKIITRGERPGRAAQCHKLPAFMKKRKEEILRDKEQSTVVQPTEQLHNSPSVQPTEQLQNSPPVQSNDTYVYGVGMLAVLAIGVCVFFAYETFPKNKKPVNEKQDQPPKRRHMLYILYNK